VVLYLALAPKSAASYIAFEEAKKEAKETSHLMPPHHILNAPTKWMKKNGFGKGYQWDHDTPEGFSGQEYFPESLQNRVYYQPVARGFERDLQKRISYFNQLKTKKQA